MSKVKYRYERWGGRMVEKMGYEGEGTFMREQGQKK